MLSTQRKSNPPLDIVKESVRHIRKFPRGTLLKDAFPDIYKEIHPTMNPGIDIEKLTYGSNTELYWMCSKPCNCIQRIWKAPVCVRTSCALKAESRGSDKNGCPFCCGKSTCRCDSLATQYPDLLNAFDQERNPGIDPYTIACYSNESYNWQCPYAQCDCHIYSASVTNMVQGYNKTGYVPCLFCSGLDTCPHDSLAVKYPKILEQWDWEANPGSDPYFISSRSSMRFKWRCPIAKCNCHQFENAVNNMTQGFDKTGKYVCPFCYGMETCPHDSVATLCPELVAEFVPELNPDIDLRKISTGSGIKVIWRCLVDPTHDNWKAAIYHQARGTKNCCPTCSESKLEKACREILQKYGITYKPQHDFPDCRHVRILYFDFYLPHMRIIIEVDGEQHFFEVRFNGKHAKLAEVQYRDNIKNKYTRKNNIHLLRVSYSEKERLEEHIINFIQEVKNSTGRVERFIGKEYQAPPQPPVPSPTQSPVRLLLVQP